jgi:hypothetical protein
MNISKDFNLTIDNLYSVCDSMKDLIGKNINYDRFNGGSSSKGIIKDVFPIPENISIIFEILCSNGVKDRIAIQGYIIWFDDDTIKAKWIDGERILCIYE